MTRVTKLLARSKRTPFISVTNKQGNLDHFPLTKLRMPGNIIYREAIPGDIPQLHFIRLAVKENALSNPDLVKETDYIPFLVSKGKGWIGMVDEKIVGFSIVDLENNNVWALFIHPDYEGISLGKNLHKLMLDWYFSQTSKTIWLGTAPGTRAEVFYRKRG